MTCLIYVQHNHKILLVRLFLPLTITKFEVNLHSIITIHIRWCIYDNAILSRQHLHLCGAYFITLLCVDAGCWTGFTADGGRSSSLPPLPQPTETQRMLTAYNTWHCEHELWAPAKSIISIYPINACISSHITNAARAIRTVKLQIT